jgi:diguanylate cyclase (GGDEF)-like protein
MYDAVTGLYSFAVFQKRVKECLKSHDEKYLMIRLDIENFKMVNNIFGLAAGDLLLSEIGKMLRTASVPGLICCRVEGDVFYAFVKQECGQDLVDMILQNQFYGGKDKNSPVQIDIGIYGITDTSMPISVMCDRASMALETIKGNHMEQVAIYNENIYQNMVSEQVLCAQLGGAIKDRQIKMYLQPQVNKNDIVLGAEALVRWEHPTRGLIMPGEFLPLFERNYMIAQIDQYIWEVACMQLKEWERSRRGYHYISVNVSPRDFECMNVYDELMCLVRRYKIDPKRLHVEITETTIMRNPKEQIKMVGKLRTAGFYVEMDDFGSGYSSFSMLKDIKIDAIKLDMRFLSASINAERGKKILNTIISLAKDLDMTVIAEGVEQKEDVDYLKKIKCDILQGYYYARPMKMEDFELMVDKSNRMFQEKIVS